MSDNGSDPAVALGEAGSAGDVTSLAWSAIGTTPPNGATYYPAPSGVRGNAVSLSVGRFAQPLSMLYISSGGSVVAVASNNAAVINFGSVSAGTILKDCSIQAISTLTATGVGFW